MKLINLSILMLTTFTACIVSANSPKPQGKVLADGIFAPEHGIICDQKAGFCVDSFGISMEFTKMYLGEKSQEKMLKMIDEVGSDNFDPLHYSFSNKVYCDSGERVCYQDRFNETKQADFNAVLFEDKE